MKRIYVSYRREDTSESYGRIVERLRGYFGSEAVLRTDSTYTADGSTISATEYRAYTAGAMKQCAALLLIIGPRWRALGASDSSPLNDLDDPVRIEIEAALRAGIPVVPALVQQARMPVAEDLPASLRLLLEQGQQSSGRHKQESLLSLVSRSGLEVRRDPDFGGDAQRLCEIIENLAGLEAASLERAQGAIGRTLRNATLVASGALIAHSAILAYFALHTLIPLAPTLALNTTWLPTIIISSLMDWGVYFLASYAVARRTGDVGLGVGVAVTAYVLGLATGIATFADIAWSQWTALTGPIATPSLLVGAPGWLLAPALLLMRPFILLFALLALGTPVGLLASFVLGSLGASIGGRVAQRISTYQRERGREAMMRSETDAPRKPGGTLRRRSKGPASPIGRETALAGKVFISYRRDDSAVMCGSIYDRLVDIFGVGTIFKDVDMIPVGVNFEKFISATLERCVAQVVVVGPRWTTMTTPQGARRLDDPTDFVRLEIELALRGGVKVIPALVQGATLPSADELPESLRPLADLQPVTVRYAPDFDRDMRDLGLMLAPAIWPSSSRTNLLKRLTTARLRADATQVAALFWFALSLAYGVILGVETVHGLRLPAVTSEPFLLTFLGASPVIMTALAAISGAHLGYRTGKTRRAFWLAWRSVLAGCVALALTTQILGARLYPSPAIAMRDLFYREFATGAFIAAGTIALAPALIAALLGCALTVAIRRRWRQSSPFVRTPKAIQTLYTTEDAAIGARITRGLDTYFGKRARPPRRYRLQSIARSNRLAQRLSALYEARFLPLRLRSLRDERDDGDRADPMNANAMTRALRRTACILVLIGPSWNTRADQDLGMSDPTNPLRVRIEAALALDRPIVPVLLTGATMPSPDQLPASMREFAMLNAAWVRAEPDYTGDMRRLTRVIERLTSLGERQRAREVWLPMLLGALLSALTLAGVDAFAALQFTLTGVALDRTVSIELGGALIVVDLLIYGVTSGLVTRWSGKRQNGVLAGLLGSSLAMLAGAYWTQLTQISQVASFGVLGTATVDGQTLSSIALFMFIRVPFQTLGALAASALGSFYGKVAYRGRERSIQERRLYAMARSAIQRGPLTEMSARSVRATGTFERDTITPAASASQENVIDAPSERFNSCGFADKSGTDAETSASGGTAGGRPDSPDSPDSEESRREALLGEMRAAGLRARKRARTRLAMIGGLVATIALMATLIGQQVYLAQANGLIAEATAAANNQTATQTTIQGVTATALVSSANHYSTASPGNGCDLNDTRGTWSESDVLSEGYECLTTSTIITTNSLYGRHLVALEVSMSQPPFTTAYALDVDIAFTSHGTCAGLMTNGDRSTSSGIGFEICDNGSWGVSQYHSFAFDSATLRSTTTHLTFASGHLKLSAINHLTVRVHAYGAEFLVNGTQIATLTDARFGATTQFVAICVNWDSSFSLKASASVKNFKYQPIAN